jgi:hypothetical protein
LTTVNPRDIRNAVGHRGIASHINPFIKLNTVARIIIRSIKSIRYPDIALYVPSCLFIAVELSDIKMIS